MTNPDGSLAVGAHDLRDAVGRAWAEMMGVVDAMLSAGRLPHRDVIVDMARFLDSAMPAVRAYERAALRLSGR